jgi:1-acyl-sn-glycerol-3-phosphate acyltransferase
MKISIEGAEHLKTEKSCVLISNHQSLMDIIVLFTITSMNLRMVLKKELLYIPIFGWSLWWNRFISIDRGSRRKALKSIDRGAKKIRKGTSVLLFPEGTRSSDGKLAPFQAGSFIMAIKSQVPIIPITISGTINVVHKKTPLNFHFNKGIKVIVSPPIDTSRYQLDQRDELKDEVEAVIRENYKKIRHLSQVGTT